LPLYFTASPEEGGRNDFLGRPDTRTKRPLQSFGINRGGYIGFFNPESGDDETFALRGDARAKKRLQVKSRASLTRRSMRYKLGTLAADRLAQAGHIAPTAGGGRRANRRREAAPRTERRVLAVERLDCSEERKAARRA
jgi:hypothetical protein